MKPNNNYNPLKMAGSWIGFSLMFANVLYLSTVTPALVEGEIYTFLFAVILNLVLFFLAGYGLHTYFRWTRNRKIKRREELNSEEDDE